MSSDAFMEWFSSRKLAHQFMINKIPFAELRNWHFDHATGNLHHDSGKFFSIEGIRVKTNFGLIPNWDQPIINQPEIGILGIIVKKFDGVLLFLMQVKMEPGNVNMVQLSPTLQATRSNFTRVHQGNSPPYLEYFLTKSKLTLVDVLQSEQGARFLRKRNRNIIIEVEKDVPVLDDYCWLTLGQIQKLLRLDNVVNMDARTVIACIPLADPSLTNLPPSELKSMVSDYAGSGAIQTDGGRFSSDLIESIFNTEHHLNTSDEIISWFTGHKIKYDLDVKSIPMKDVHHWIRTEKDIHHENNKFFSVIACHVEADNREVSSWSQPLLEASEQGIIGMIIKKINGVLHLLIQAKVEPGNFDILEMAPTVQCITGSHKNAPENERPPFLDFVQNANESQVRLTSLQSEEGGRFFREENRNIIIEVGDEFPIEVPDNYCWMTMSQIKEFIKYNNFVNVQCRCLLSGLGFL